MLTSIFPALRKVSRESGRRLLVYLHSLEDDGVSIKLGLSWCSQSFTANLDR